MAVRTQPVLDQVVATAPPLEVSLWRGGWTILAKEVRTEFRSRELLTTTAVFALMVVVMFSFS
ncbi:MAG TPA: hypothetical protein VL099_10820, partial [Candidatus Binatia bacterium]|nr:hypothetical protein [Candidatus Binatia bacterium]